ncbi:hypothetical protein Tco_0151571 [Tanacetum coccineum]
MSSQSSNFGNNNLHHLELNRAQYWEGCLNNSTSLLEKESSTSKSSWLAKLPCSLVEEVMIDGNCGFELVKTERMRVDSSLTFISRIQRTPNNFHSKDFAVKDYANLAGN